MKAVALIVAFLLSAPLSAQLRTHSTWITLPDGSRITCFSVEGTHGSTTHCRPVGQKRSSAANTPRVRIEIEPELEAAWKVAYRYYKKAHTKKGWKPRVKGPLGDLVITPEHVILGAARAERRDVEVEEAIWQLTCRNLGVDPDDSP